MVLMRVPALLAQTSALTASDFFNGSVLHRVDLQMNSRDWEKLRANFQLNDYYPADLVWQNQTVRNVGIRSRGTGSRSGTKPGLRVDIDRYTTDQEFLGLKSFILDNLTQDPSMMKEVAVMAFWERMGLPAPREAFCRLYLNDTYVGLYAIVESVDKRLLKDHFGENDGYLFEYKNKDNYHFEWLGSSLELYDDFFVPKTHEDAPMSTLYGPIGAMIRAINDSSPDNIVSGMRPYLDLTQFMTHVAMENFVAEYDGILGYAGMNNFYLYRFENKTLSVFIVWDKDSALQGPDFPIWNNIEANELSARAVEVSELRNAYLLALARSAAVAGEQDPNSPGAGWFERFISQKYQMIRSSALEDPLKPFPNERFEDEVSKVLRFARERGNFVLSQVSKELPQPVLLKRR